MKIESGIKGPIAAMETQLKKTTQASAKLNPSVKTADAPYNVDLSSATEHQSPDEISHARVAAIRDQLASGTYNISGKDVANKILGVLKG